MDCNGVEIWVNDYGLVKKFLNMVWLLYVQYCVLDGVCVLLFMLCGKILCVYDVDEIGEYGVYVVGVLYEFCFDDWCRVGEWLVDYVGVLQVMQ